MNNDLIGRDEMLEMLCECCSDAAMCNSPCIKYNAMTQIPTVDAEPVRHGKRTVYTIWHSSAWGEIRTKFECCGFDVSGTKKYNYCPNCGTKMDAEVSK